MWQLKVALLVLVLASVVTSVYSSCDQIALPNCECKHPRDKRYEIQCQSTGLSAMPSKVNHTLPDGDASGNFSYNSIESIPDYYFVFMKHFDMLDFTSNRISELVQNSLTGLETRLTTLSLKQNRITTIPEMALRQFIRLNKLDLGSNKIDSPCGIHTADVITYSLANNGIKELGDFCFSESSQVQSLDLSYNDINSVGAEAFQGMSSLKSLDLGFNQISDLGVGFTSLIALNSFESLSLRGNNMEYLGSLCRHYLPHIKEIDLGYNDLLDIQKYCFNSYTELGSGPNMFLNFEHNRISALAGSAFAGLTERLTKLKLNHNKISEVNVNSFRDLRKLAQLYLDNNNINSLEFLRNWEDNALLELSISNNMIAHIAQHVFGEMLKLTKLSLDGNMLLNIESAAFNGMAVLDDLSIRYNLLTNLADGAFSGLGQLKKLRLSGNALVTLKNCTFAELNRLVLFHFEDNLLLCDCDLLWVLEFTSGIDARGIPDPYIDEPVLDDTCHYPKEYAGKDMVNVVSYNCPVLPTNACFGLEVTSDEPEGNALNVSWKWNPGNAIQSVVLRQIDVETNSTIANVSVTTTVPPYELSSVLEDTIYKICVTVALVNGEMETDCTVFPSLIKKPTTVAPSTWRTPESSGLNAGSIAAIILGIILILLIILLVLFAVYLCKTKKYRHLMPTKYANAGQSDSYHGSIERSPSSNGKSDPLDFRAADEDDPMMAPRPRYAEDDL